MQTQEIAASLDFMRKDLNYSPAMVTEALERGGPMLLKGAEAFARELADYLGGITWDEACPCPRNPLSAVLALCICSGPSFKQKPR